MNRPKPLACLHEDFVFIDIESTGLHEGSYPIEVAIATDALDVQSWLIKPAEGWTERLWSKDAQKVHGITRDECVRQGVDVVTLAEQLNEILLGKYVLSDNPRYDADWLTRLFQAARVRPLFAVDHVFHAYNQQNFRMENYLLAESLVAKIWPHIHRAAEDALGLAAMYRMTVDADFMAKVQDAAREAA